MFWTPLITVGKLNILVDYDGHARLTDFGVSSVVCGMGSAAQVNGHTTVRTAPEILEGAGTITQEADVFAFGVVVIEVGPYPLLPLRWKWRDGRVA